ncbi:MAG: hypothetical protein EA365_05405 [Gloeocapsa sp. DLM2.Bin57]|nr:MAG: hypothetical protein EA365_05405 [Gloeocapsa sp. DLM2.Bin57]
MRNILLASGLALMTTFNLAAPNVLAQSRDSGTVIDSETVSIITGNGNRVQQSVNITSTRQRYFDAPGNDGTVIRSYVNCDILGDDNTCQQYKVIRTEEIRRGGRSVRRR